jgi:hypothetical protein
MEEIASPLHQSSLRGEGKLGDQQTLIHAVPSAPKIQIMLGDLPIGKENNKRQSFRLDKR